MADTPLTFAIIGASGDLARRKLYPALFALYCQGFLPRDFHIFGFARSMFDDEQFRKRVTEHLTCRYAPGEACAARMAEFLDRCHYVQGQYDSPDSFFVLEKAIRDVSGPVTNQVFYFAVPPSVFLDVARSMGNAGLKQAGDTPWIRIVVEKPFGRDRESFAELSRELIKVYPEEQIFRIDHYLGKEVIQNMMVLRFANAIFEPLWNQYYIKNVQISWLDDAGLEGRGGYFDSYGIIRDIMQNHLLQILALLSMEQPLTARGEDVRDEKVKVLRSVEPVRLENLVLGQYTSGKLRGVTKPGYREDDTVPNESLTATYAACVLNIRNRRWDGVPFIMRAGKALGRRGAEVHVLFQPTPGSLYRIDDGPLPENELIIRIQPDEAIHLEIVNKVPGLGMKVGPSDLDLRYSAVFKGEIPEAYEALLLDVIRGDKGLFIREDEVAAAWEIFTPVLCEIEENKIAPEHYAFGSMGPLGAENLVEQCGTEWR